MPEAFGRVFLFPTAVGWLPLLGAPAQDTAEVVTTDKPRLRGERRPWPDLSAALR